MTLEFVALTISQPELQAHVDDPNGQAAQLDRALDEIQGIGNGRRLFTALNLLDLEDVDNAFHGVQLEGEELAGCHGALGRARGRRMGMCLGGALNSMQGSPIGLIESHELLR